MISGTLAQAKIDLSAIQENYSYLKSRAPDSKALAVIKAHAYGHGLKQVAEALHEADGFAVARFEEAIFLKGLHLGKRILLLEGVLTYQQFKQIVSHRFDFVVHHQYQLDFIKKYHEENTLISPISVWVKVNTGMNRLGFSLAQLPDVVSTIEQYDWLTIETLMTHFANADSGKPSAINKPLKQFEKAKNIVNQDELKTSLANSAAILAYPASHGDWLRPGIAMYGSSPFEKPVEELKTVMTLSTKVISLNEISAGEAVGYGGIWKAKQDTKIAVVGIGYGDGYPRHATDGTPVLVNGKIRPLAGRVSMDMITVDVGLDLEIEVGDEVILWGQDEEGNTLSVDEVAKHCNTIAYDMFCGLTQRVERVYFGWTKSVV